MVDKYNESSLISPVDDQRLWERIQQVDEAQKGCSRGFSCAWKRPVKLSREHCGPWSVTAFYRRDLWADDVCPSTGAPSETLEHADPTVARLQ